MLNKERLICDLCGLEIVGEPFTFRDGDQVKCFCCEGCLGIYRIMFDVD
ncbi:MAG: TRASH domain-containing protein [Nitrospirae bacterium]|nr:TRASH domain-containing protein [Nitrospirota bacterium]